MLKDNLCGFCKHKTGVSTCKAFPISIPYEMYDTDHVVPMPELGQKNDIAFEPGYDEYFSEDDYNRYLKERVEKAKAAYQNK